MTVLLTPYAYLLVVGSRSVGYMAVLGSGEYMGPIGESLTLCRGVVYEQTSAKRGTGTPEGVRGGRVGYWYT